MLENSSVWKEKLIQFLVSIQCFAVTTATLIFYYKPVHETNCTQVLRVLTSFPVFPWVSSLQRPGTWQWWFWGVTWMWNWSTAEMNQAMSFPNCSPATGVSSARRNVFESVQWGLVRTWWRGPPGMAREHVEIKEEEFKGSYGLQEFWAPHAPQTKSSCGRQEEPQANSEPQQHPEWILPVLARTILHLTGHHSINMAEIYQTFHPSLQDLCTRDEPQACCLCSPEE